MAVHLHGSRAAVLIVVHVYSDIFSIILLGRVEQVGRSYRGDECAVIRMGTERRLVHANFETLLQLYFTFGPHIKTG